MVATICYLKCSVPKKKLQNMQRKRKVWPTPWKKQATEISCESGQMLKLTENFKVAILNMFKELKKTMIKVVTKSRRVLFHSLLY